MISPPAEVTVLSVGWGVYEAPLDETEPDRHSRLAYDGLPLALNRFLERRRDISHAALTDEWQH